MIHDYSIGEKVYVFSETLREVIEGVIEGFEGTQNTRVKVLQQVPDGMIRHIVSWVYVFRSTSRAEEVLKEFDMLQRDEQNLYPGGFTERVYTKGMTVYLRQSGSLIVDSSGNPYVYQIIKVFRNSKRASLVNAYGEPVGTFNYSDIEFCSNDSLFKSTDYYVGQEVSWAEGEDVFEGVISKIRDNSAEVSEIKRLMPLDYKKSVPYYKLSGDDHYVSKNNMILASIIGDDIDQE